MEGVVEGGAEGGVEGGAEGGAEGGVELCGNQADDPTAVEGSKNGC